MWATYSIDMISLFAVYSPYVAECGDVLQYVSAIGASIDLSTLLQYVYSMEQLTSSSTDVDYQHVNPNFPRIIVTSIADLPHAFRGQCRRSILSRQR